MVCHGREVTVPRVWHPPWAGLLTSITAIKIIPPRRYLRLNLNKPSQVCPETHPLGGKLTADMPDVPANLETEARRSLGKVVLKRMKPVRVT